MFNFLKKSIEKCDNFIYKGILIMGDRNGKVEKSDEKTDENGRQE
jgi:hypothetical protein